MSRVRTLEIKHFRSIQHLHWTPGSGINCLIGPGDSGKSSVLDAIDLCLGVKRSIQFGNAQFRDSDFYRLDVSQPIQISLTIGALDDSLKSLDHYGLYLRGFHETTKELSDEPEVGAETVLTLRLTVNEDLEPIWSLYSDRAEAQGEAKSLHWADRVRLASTRLGEPGDHHLSWKRGSLLHKLSDEKADISADLAKVAREARKAFGDKAKPQVSETLMMVETAAKSLGISVGEVSALLDSNSISFSGGTICLHDGEGVPLRGLGLGSTRLLVAALQRQVASRAGVVLLDEVEHGLEPHRIMRLIDSLGAKEKVPPLQVFMTTHSPVALKELKIEQLYVLRQSTTCHEARHVGIYDAQGTVRDCPEAFLAPSVIVCEGATEVGFLRGLDLHRQATQMSIAANGVALTDGKGENAYKRAIDLASLGYRTLLLRDNDKAAKATDVAKFKALGGTVIQWRDEKAIEQEIFSSVSPAVVERLLSDAICNKGEDSVSAMIKNHGSSLLECQNNLTDEGRKCLGLSAKKGGWFKTVSAMGAIAKAHIGPGLPTCEPGFKKLVETVFSWIDDGKKRN